jgi:Reverse transcriptase (RNA-dependent DNA polymerase)
MATRLGYLAETTDLLYSEQIGDRSQKSAINAAIALTHDIQLAKTEGLKSSYLFLDIIGVFDHVSINQLLGFCQRFKLPISICKWIKFFISNRYIQLAFDGEKSEKNSYRYRHIIRITSIAYSIFNIH